MPSTRARAAVLTGPRSVEVREVEVAAPGPGEVQITTLYLGEFHHNRPRIISSQVGSLSPELGPMWDLARRQELVFRLLTELDLAPLFTHEFPIERVSDAYAAVDQVTGGVVQCVLTYGE